MIRLMTIVRCGLRCLASNSLVTLSTKHSRDDEKLRVFGLNEAASAKDQIAAIQLLNWRHSLTHPAYIQLLSDLRAIRTECNEDMLAIAEHIEEVRELPTVH